MTNNYLQWVAAEKAKTDEARTKKQLEVDSANANISTVGSVLGVILGILLLLL